MYRILALNPGSTSTKAAVFEDDKPVFVQTIRHTTDELAPFTRVADQFEFRKALVMKLLEENNIELKSLDAIVSRGGLPCTIKGGAYGVNDDMVWQLKNKPLADHASNIGALIAHSLGSELGIPAYIYDGITVDEMDPINKICGLPDMQRSGFCHTLNTRAAAKRWAQENGKKYEDITVIVAHLGGGITINLQTEGHIADVISDDEGPFSPERAGGLPLGDVIKLCYSGKYTQVEMKRLINRKAGLNAFFGTTDAQEVEAMYETDERAKLVYDAMALAIAKNIAKEAPYVYGKVDQIILTGGIAYSKRLTQQIIDRVSFIAPVTVYAGEDEMQSLVNGCLRVLNGEEEAKTFVRSE